MSSRLQIDARVDVSAVGFDLAGTRVIVVDHTDMTRSAIVRCARQEACKVVVAKRTELDLTCQDQTERYLFTIPTLS